MAFLTKRRVFTAKKESSYGAGPTVAIDITSDAFLVESDGPQVTYEPVARTGQRHTISPLRNADGPKYQTMSGTAEFKTSGSAADGGATDICDLYPILLACGLDAQRTAEDGGDNQGLISYQPRSYGFESCQVEVWDAGTAADSSVKHVMAGCVGSCSWELQAGQIPMMSFNLSGLYTKPADDAVTDWTTASGYASSMPQLVESIAATVDGYASLTVRSLSIDLANEIATRYDANSSESVAGFHLTGRSPSFSLTAEAVLASDKDLWQLLDEGDTLALSAVVANGSVQNRIYFSLPTATIGSMELSDESGILVVNISGPLYGDDDELLIVQGYGTSAGGTDDI